MLPRPWSTSVGCYRLFRFSSGLCYTSWLWSRAVESGRYRPMLGATLSDSTNRTQIQVLVKTAAVRTAETRTRQVYTSRGGWARDHLNSRGGHGSLTTDGCYFLADVVGAHGGRTKEKTTHPCPNPGGILPTDESEAAQASQTSWQEGQASLGGSLHRSATHRNPC
jgi:hypothetical protein